MSSLRVLWPDEPLAASGSVNEPAILRFSAKPAEAPRQRFDVIGRARTLFNNRCCTSCGYPVVEPIELSDGICNRNGIVIPGTATLVGFHCRGCHAEWSV